MTQNIQNKLNSIKKHIKSIEQDEQATLQTNNFQTRLTADFTHSALYSSKGNDARDKPSAGLSLPCGRFNLFSVIRDG
jgi:hypothetical protein